MTDRSQQLRSQLVATLRAKNAVAAGTAIEAAFLTIPREAFVPPTTDQPLERIYADSFIVTRWRDGTPVVSSSAPSLMARMLGLLDLAPGQRVLEIGTGSGYNAALLANIVGPHGAVVSVEIDEQAAADADAALGRLGCPCPVTVVCQDGTAGSPAHAPFDRIIVTALAATVPRAWHDQLHDRGVLVTPLLFGPSAYTQMVVAFDRAPAGFASRGFASAGFMALRDTAVDTRTSPALGIFDDARGAWTRKLSGDGLLALDEPARRALLQTLAGQPHERRIAIHDPYSFALYATLAAADGCVVAMFETGAGSAVAVVHGSGRSIAALSSSKDPTARGMLDLKLYGTDEALQLVFALLKQWQQWSLPTSVTVGVDYRARPDGQPTWQRGDTTAVVGSPLP